MYPNWYDPICIANSLAYSTVAAFMLCHESLWLVLVLSGIVSALYRSMRVFHRASELLFVCDVMFACASFGMLLPRFPGLVVLFVGLMFVDWIAYVSGSMTTSCAMHCALHVTGTIVLALMVRRLIHQRRTT